MADLLLGEVDLSARLRKSLSVSRDIPAGSKLKLEVENDELHVVVPAGKSWSVSVSVSIDKTDA